MSEVTIPVRNPDALTAICLEAIGRRPERALAPARIAAADRIASRDPLRLRPTVKRLVIDAILRAGKVSDGVLPEYVFDLSFRSLTLPRARMTVKTLQQIARRCPQLRRLHLSDCFYVDDDALAAVLTHMAALRDLSVEGCRKLTDEAVEHLCTRGSRLHAINISGCYNITSDAVHRLVTTHPNRASMRELHLSGTNLRHETIDFLAEQYPALRRVSLGFTEATEQQLMTLIKNHGEITHLSVHWCQGMNDRVLSELPMLAPRLQALDICGVKHLSNEYLLGFVQAAYPPDPSAPRDGFGEKAEDEEEEEEERTWSAGPERPRLRTLNCKFTALSQSTVFAIESECPGLKLLKNSGTLA